VSVSHYAVTYIVLAVMCIYLISMSLSCDGNHQQDLGKPSLKIAKPSHRWEVVGHLISLGGSEKTQSAWREEQGMDPFAVGAVNAELLKYV
jgi:hypothetical protein